MKRDMRDPQQIGGEYLELRAEGCDMDTATQWAYAASTDVDSDPTCVEKYGRPQDLKPKFMEVQVK